MNLLPEKKENCARAILIKATAKEKSRI